MIALLLAAVLAVGAQGPVRAPDREAHVVAMRALARAAIERDPEFNRAGQEALRRAVQVSGDQREQVTVAYGDAEHGSQHHHHRCHPAASRRGADGVRSSEPT